MVWKSLTCLPFPRELLYIVRKYWGRIDSLLWLDQPLNQEEIYPVLHCWVQSLVQQLPVNHEYVISVLRHFYATKWRDTQTIDFDFSDSSELLARSFGLPSPALALEVINFIVPDLVVSPFEYTTRWQPFVSRLFKENIDRWFVKELIRQKDSESFIEVLSIVDMQKETWRTLYKFLPHGGLRFLERVVPAIQRYIGTIKWISLLYGILRLGPSLEKNKQIRWIRNKMDKTAYCQFTSGKLAREALVRSGDVPLAATLISWEHLTSSDKDALLRLVLSDIGAGKQRNDMLEFLTTKQDRVRGRLTLLGSMYVRLMQNPLAKKVLERSGTGIYLNRPSSPHCFDLYLTTFKDPLAQKAFSEWTQFPPLRTPDYLQVWHKHGFCLEDYSRKNKRRRISF